jgi:hypothetical protein
MKVGESKSVKSLQESRQIVKEILKFGVSESQKIDVIYFLTLELENREAIEQITNILKKFRSGIKPDEKTQYGNKDPDSGDNKLLGV